MTLCFYEKKPGVDPGFLLLETCTTSITDFSGAVFAHRLGSYTNGGGVP